MADYLFIYLLQLFSKQMTPNSINYNNGELERVDKHYLYITIKLHILYVHQLCINEFIYSRCVDNNSANDVEI